MLRLFSRGRKVTFGSPEAEDVLRRHSLDTLDAIYRAAASARSRHAARAVWSHRLTDANSPFTAYFKLEWGPARIWPRMTDLASGQVLQSLLEREWRGIAAMKSLGFLVPERLALLEERRPTRRCAVVLREVEPKASLRDMFSSGAWRSLPEHERFALLEAVKETLLRIHAAGLSWRGADCRHFYPAKDAQGRWQMWLIDCEGVHRVHSRRGLVRDCDKFFRSLVRGGIDEDIVRLARHYREQTIAAA
jgi:hypothetical protein